MNEEKQVNVVIAIITAIITWFVAQVVTPAFNTTPYIGFHINHSFIGLLFILFGVMLNTKEKISDRVFIIVLAVGLTLIVHNAIIFGEM